MLIADALRDDGHTVFEAANGDEAYSVLAAGISADLLITDIQMPGTLDGRGLARAARQLRPELAIVLSSAQPDAARSVPELADAVIGKPFSIAQLLAVARRLLRPA